MKIWRNKMSGMFAAITAVVAVVVVLSMVFVWSVAPVSFAVIFTVAVVGTLAAVALFMPRRTIIEEDGVTCKLLAGSIKIAGAEILEIKRIDKNDLSGSIRLFGSSGFCGYLGRFRNKKLGVYSAYITEMRNLVLVRTAKRKYVFNAKL